jgi:hypothetical protein
MRQVEQSLGHSAGNVGVDQIDQVGRTP